MCPDGHVGVALRANKVALLNKAKRPDGHVGVALRANKVALLNKAKRPGHEDSEADQMYELETERMLAPPRLRKQRPVLVQDSWSSVGR